MTGRISGLPVGLGLAALLLGGCHKLTSVKVDPATATLEAMDQTAQLHAKQLDGDGKPMSKEAKVTWASDKPEVATVTDSGKATAKKSGTATITATVGKVQGKATVEVHLPGKITGKDVTLTQIGQTQQVAYEVDDEDGKPMAGAASKLAVTVADPKVATVSGPSDSGWTFTAVAPGKTQVTVALDAFTQPFNLTVELPDINELKLSSTSLKMKVGEAQHLTATPMAAGQPVTGQPITYSTSDAKVATVDADGTIHAAGKGTTSITVTAGAKSATVKVSVKK